MSEAKIQFKLGAIEFSGEGEKDWISQQLDKILKQAPQLLAIAPALIDTTTNNVGAAHQIPMAADPAIAQKTLVSFLGKAKGAAQSQVKKFLATAVWLEAKGKTRIATGDIVQALKDSKQNKLSNASGCLAKNIEKGFCEKEGTKFFVTEAGKNTI